MDDNEENVAEGYAVDDPESDDAGQERPGSAWARMFREAKPEPAEPGAWGRMFRDATPEAPAEQPPPAPHQLDVVTPTGKTTYTYLPGGGLRAEGQATQPPPPLTMQQMMQRIPPGASPQERLSLLKLSFAEQKKLQQWEQGKAYVQEQVATGAWTKEVGDAALMQLRTGIDPLKKRQEAADAQAKELAFQQKAEDAKRNQALWHELRKMGGQNVEGEIAVVKTPDGREMHYTRDQHGTPKLMEHDVLAMKHAFDMEKLQAQAGNKPEKGPKEITARDIHGMALAEMKSKFGDKMPTGDAHTEELLKAERQIKARIAGQAPPDEAPSATGSPLADMVNQARWRMRQAGGPPAPQSAAPAATAQPQAPPTVPQAQAPAAPPPDPVRLFADQAARQQQAVVGDVDAGKITKERGMELMSALHKVYALKMKANAPGGLTQAERSQMQANEAEIQNWLINHQGMPDPSRRPLTGEDRGKTVNSVGPPGGA